MYMYARTAAIDMFDSFINYLDGSLKVLNSDKAKIN